MSSTQNIIAYAIQSGLLSDYQPVIVVGQGQSGAFFSPQNPQDDTYWIAIFDAMNPTKLVQDFLIPGSQNSTIPNGLASLMSNPGYLFAVTTQALSTLHVPQGDFYNFLASYGAGEELQKLEELNASLSCGTFGTVSYVLTGSCGPTGNPDQPPSYEVGEFQQQAVLLMSLIGQPNGQGPYSLIDTYTFPING